MNLPKESSTKGTKSTKIFKEISRPSEYNDYHLTSEQHEVKPFVVSLSNHDLFRVFRGQSQF